MIENGHSWSEVQGYTLQQINLFAETIIKRNMEKTQQDIFIHHVASQFPTKDVKNYSKQFSPEEVFKPKGASQFLKDFPQFIQS